MSFDIHKLSLPRQINLLKNHRSDEFITILNDKRLVNKNKGKKNNLEIDEDNVSNLISSLYFCQPVLYRQIKKNDKTVNKSVVNKAITENIPSSIVNENGDENKNVRKKNDPSPNLKDNLIYKNNLYSERATAFNIPNFNKNILNTSAFSINILNASVFSNNISDTPVFSNNILNASVFSNNISDTPVFSNNSLNVSNLSNNAFNVTSLSNEVFNMPHLINNACTIYEDTLDYFHYFNRIRRYKVIYAKKYLVFSFENARLEHKEKNYNDCY